MSATLQKIVSGGQTGVDRAALDAAMAAGLEVAGWCPRGRRAEDGIIADRYPLEETPQRDYRQRTEWNVRDADGTLVLYWGELHNGTLATVRFARDTHRRPLLLVNLLEPLGVREAAKWVADNDIQTLNVAGPRESSRRGIYRMAYDYLETLFREAL
ncbi:MAG: putative molybdenum carrier protein [Gammaproteobacteria bacterium]